MELVNVIHNLNMEYDNVQTSVRNILEECFGVMEHSKQTMITISFLRTSLYFGEPKFRFHVFSMDQMWEQPLYEKDLRADWLLVRCEDNEKDEESLVEQRKELKAILMYISCYFKYFVAECETWKSFQERHIQPPFYITFGEYMDWQYPIFCYQEELDIFQNEKEEALTFRRFQTVIYQDKKFDQLDFSNSKFIGCEFRDCQWENVVLTDAMFQNCSFQNVTVRDCICYGITVSDSTFQKCEFRNVAFKQTTITKETLHGIYKQSEFIQTHLEDTEFNECNTEEVSFS